jgi:hypothetical protein
VLAALLPATPAAAHGADAPGATNYRTTVTGVVPAQPGVTVRAVEAGARLELTNHTRSTVEVLGYQGEPYLEVRPDGVYQNAHSPATYLNATLSGDAAVPATADPSFAPQWTRIAGGRPVVRWHDHRTHWMGAAPPPAIVANPGQPHRIRDWAVPLRINMSTVDIRGALDWVSPPAVGLWWALTALVALAVGSLGLVWGRVLPVLAGVAVVGGLAALVYAAARARDAGAVGVGGTLIGIVASQAWPAATGLAALVAGWYAALRRPAADLALGLAGMCLGLIAGLGNAAVFARGVAPVPWPSVWARVATLAVIGAGAGLALAAGLRLRATPSPAAPLPAAP